MSSTGRMREPFSSIVTSWLLLSVFYSISDSTFYTMMKVWDSSHIGVFELWNHTGVHCDVPGKLLRNNYIDHLNNSCIRDIDFIFQHDLIDYSGHMIKIDGPFTHFNLESMLSTVPTDFEVGGSPYISKIQTNNMPDKYFINNDNFEYRLMDSADLMYAGFYHKTADTYSPKFVIIWNGTKYEAGLNSSVLVSDRKILFLNVVANIGCTLKPTDITVSNSHCPVPEITAMKPNVEAAEGTTFTLSCSVTSSTQVRVRWTHNGQNITSESKLEMHSLEGEHNLTVNQFNTTDAGTYTCYAENPFGINATDITVKLIGPPVVGVSKDQYALVDGNSISFQCNIAGNPVPNSVFWKKDGTMILTSSTKYSGSNLLNPSLMILNATSADLGIYTCCATNGFQGSSTTCGPDIMFFGPPQIIINPSSSELQPGMNNTIECTYNSLPVPTEVYWMINNSKRDVVAQAGRTGTFSQTIMAPTKMDLGAYVCCVVNTVATSCAKSIIGAKPFVTVPQINVTMTTLQSGVLECEVTAFPFATTFSWNITLANGEKTVVNSNTSKYEISLNDRPFLTIKNALFTDEGTYVCIASNSFGETNGSSVTLNVYGVVVEPSQTHYNAIYSEPVELNCTITYRPNLKQVIWNYLDINKVLTPVSISDTSKYSGSTISNPHLMILYPVFKDTTTYVCTASNDYDQDIGQNVTVEVTGGYPTAYVNSNQFVVNTTGQITLPCKVTGQPNVTSVKWYQTINSVTTREISTSPSSPSLTITGIKLSDAGNYTCSATNAVGQANSSSVQLNVNEIIPMCPCTCAYKLRLDYWATQIQPNYTLEQWRVILAPLADEIRKNLTVDKTNLSSAIRKLTCAPDHRSSSKGFGLMGIVIISVVVASFLMIDIASIRRHITSIREMSWNR